MGKQSRKKRERREYKLNDKSIAVFNEQKERFIAKFGREPGPGDPVFFDPSHPTPRKLQVEPMEAGVVASMRKAGIAPHLIHAYEQTGRLITESNKHLLTEEELAEWDEAIDEYFKKNPEAES